MTAILNQPLPVLIIALVPQLLAALAGDLLRRRARVLERQDIADLDTILPAALTLLGLIIGFSFSMAVSRYDQRKNLEESEANAIGTEYVRADFLPAADAARVRDLLAKYTDQRIQFYEERDPDRLSRVNTHTTELQNALWSTVTGPAKAQPTPLAALVVSGMNDVLNSQGYTQAAWWNRVPTGAWLLMGLVAITCNLLLGYSERRRSKMTLVIFPFVLTIAFFLIADIDSPRRGVIFVVPQNLIALLQSLKPQP